MTRRDLPNLITVARLFLVAPLVWCLVMERFHAALAVTVVAGVSDALDGFLAKHYGWSSRVGGILDPIADKLLLVGGFITLGYAGLLPAWLVVLVLARDLVIVVGAALFHWLVARLQPEPSYLSKINTTVQILVLLAVLLAQIIQGFPPGLVRVLIWLTAVTTAASGVHYIWVWGWRAWYGTRPEPSHE